MIDFTFSAPSVHDIDTFPQTYPTRSADEVIQAAVAGDVLSQYELGLRFTEGKSGLPQNQSAALKWITLAYQRGYPGTPSLDKLPKPIIRPSENRSSQPTEPKSIDRYIWSFRSEASNYRTEPSLNRNTAEIQLSFPLSGDWLIELITVDNHGSIEVVHHTVNYSAVDLSNNRVLDLRVAQSDNGTVSIKIDPPLFTINQLQYAGGFILPHNTFGESSLNYAEGTIEVNGDSLFIVGHNHHDAIAEFTIPDLVNSYSIEELSSTGSPQQSFSRILNRVPGGNPERLDKIVGMQLIDGSLIVNLIEYYDGAGDNQTTTLVINDAFNLATSSVSPLHKMNGAARAAGWISEIPENWQSALGTPYVSGHASGHPIISRLSVGPSAFAVDFSNTLASSSSQSIQTVELQGFSLTHPLHADLDNSTETNTLWTHLSNAVYGFIVPGTRTYMTVGSSGGHASGVAYKNLLENGQECPGFCANESEDVYNYYWLWDMNDWSRVQHGDLSPSEVMPYDFGELSLPFQTGPFVNTISGASYDSVNDKLYLTIDKANLQGYDNPPVIAAFTIGASINLPSIPVIWAPMGTVDTTTPTYRWQTASYSDYYRIKITNLLTTQVLAEYVLHADEICDNGFCEVTPTDRPLPISSDLIVQVRGENSYRVGIWDTVSFQNTGS